MSNTIKTYVHITDNGDGSDSAYFYPSKQSLLENHAYYESEEDEKEIFANDLDYQQWGKVEIVDIKIEVDENGKLTLAEDFSIETGNQ